MVRVGHKDVPLTLPRGGEGHTVLWGLDYFRIRISGTLITVSLMTH